MFQVALRADRPAKQEHNTTRERCTLADTGETSEGMRSRLRVVNVDPAASNTPAASASASASASSEAVAQHASPKTDRQALYPACGSWAASL